MQQHRLQHQLFVLFFICEDLKARSRCWVVGVL
jgi:hypothetical protein